MKMSIICIFVVLAFRLSVLCNSAKTPWLKTYNGKVHWVRSHVGRSCQHCMFSCSLQCDSGGRQRGMQRTKIPKLWNSSRGTTV